MVWCSPKSGGVERAWAGHPRKLTMADGRHRCACVPPERVNEARAAATPTGAQLEPYEGCGVNAERCSIRK